MDELSAIVATLVDQYGYWGFLEIAAIAALTEIVKLPIKSKIEAWAVRANQDKAALTCYFVFLPMAAALLVNFAFYMWLSCSWDISLFDVKAYFASASVFYAGAVALYEAISVWYKKVLSNEKAAIAAATGSTEVDELSLTEIRAAYKQVKAQNKAQSKTDAAEARKAEAAKAEAQARAQKRAELEAELASLNSDEPAAASSGSSASAKPAAAFKTL